MKKVKYWHVLIVLSIILLPAVALSQVFGPILSTDDLAQNLKNPKLVLVDIRKVEEYKAGHIPGAVGVFYNNWAPGRGGLQNEVPMDDDLSDLLSSNGIQPDSWVVVYGKMDTIPERVNVTRVAWTLKYAGVQQVSILNGGFEKWSIGDKRPVSMDVVKPKANSYKGKFNKGLVAKKNEVLAKIGAATIVDVREVPFYSGKQKLPFVAKAGHIKGAINLPTVQVFEQKNPCCWTYKDTAALKAMAASVVGTDPAKEIIVYCDSGRVATGWWFILSEVLGYKNVKNYDGSMEEWTKDAAAPIEP